MEALESDVTKPKHGNSGAETPRASNDFSPLLLRGIERHLNAVLRCFRAFKLLHLADKTRKGVGEGTEKEYPNAKRNEICIKFTS